MNRLRWGGTKETGSQMKVCAIYNIRFTQMNCLWLGNTKETVSQIKVCVIYIMQFTRMNCLRWDKRTETVSQIKVCAMYDMRFTRMNCLRWDKRTETVQCNKYHKYCKVKIQRLQRPNSHSANIVISEKGSDADKSCMVWHNDFQLLCHMLFQYKVSHFWRHFHSAVPAASDNYTIDLS